MWSLYLSVDARSARVSYAHQIRCCASNGFTAGAAAAAALWTQVAQSDPGVSSLYQYQ